MAVSEKELTAFLCLAQQQHFTKASELLHMTPSALSRMIKRQEERLGVELFHRNKRKVVLSNAGQRFYEYAQHSLQAWQRFNADLQESKKNLAGNVSIYCSVTAAYSVLATVLPRFNQQQPHIEIQLHTGDPSQAIDRLKSGEDQLAVIAKPDKLPKNLIYKAVATSKLLLVIPRIECETRALWQHSKDLSRLEWIVPETGVVRERFNRWAKSQAQRFAIYNQVSGHEAIVSLVSLGFGVGFVPELVLQHSPQKQHVEIIEPNSLIPTISVGFCTQKHQLKNPLVNSLWNLI